MPQTSRSITQLSCSKCRASPVNVLSVKEERKIYMKKQMFHCAIVVYSKFYISARTYTTCNLKKNLKIPKG
jgi:hypothetical protein